MYGGAVWLTEMDHLAVPFYQSYTDATRQKSLAADLLIGLGETLGLGERHATAAEVEQALDHHAVPRDSYKWYTDMRTEKPMKTSGWGMGTERYLCWLLNHNDVRDMHVIPRFKRKKYLP
ncbi:asparagine--tRNA ligase-like [Amphiura filiformis]|uniref:asparagine--tRNA ligase-like n=1 Tax=Amphiura filiformis TaxID=82378 RepID=UPI003B21A54F